MAGSLPAINFKRNRFGRRQRQPEHEHVGSVRVHLDACLIIYALRFGLTVDFQSHAAVRATPIGDDERGIFHRLLLTGAQREGDGPGGLREFEGAFPFLVAEGIAAFRIRNGGCEVPRTVQGGEFVGLFISQTIHDHRFDVVAVGVTQFMEGAGHEDDGRSIMLGEPPATKGRHNNITFPSKSFVSFIFGIFLPPAR